MKIDEGDGLRRVENGGVSEGERESEDGVHYWMKNNA